jgi:hypothetical protein
MPGEPCHRFAAREPTRDKPTRGLAYASNGLALPHPIREWFPHSRLVTLRATPPEHATMCLTVPRCRSNTDLSN